MQILRDYADWPASLKGAAVAIGNFDGVHLGHAAVLSRLKAVAAERGLTPVVMCFEPHPRRYFQTDAPELRLTGFAEKARLLAAQGVQAILAQRFAKAFATLSAEVFIEKVLVGALGAAHVITGAEFVFGHQRSGHADVLQAAADDGAFTYDALAPVGNQGEGKFSSSKIREHLRQGEMALASAMLGRPYVWRRRVVHGEARGRSMGFPTANLIPPPCLLPRFGVYAAKANGQHAVANLGVRPTVGAERPLLEVHLLETEADLYGELLEVELVAHIREERRFDGLDALKEQIAKDIIAAKEVLA